jgi:hypothetical protein
MNSPYLVDQTGVTDVFEGIHWEARVRYSNRYGNSVTFTSVGSDSEWNVSANRVSSTIERLKVGESPDKVAESFPLEFN